MSFSILYINVDLARSRLAPSVSQERVWIVSAEGISLAPVRTLAAQV